MNDLRLIEGAEPLFLPGSDIGCLVVHGHTGTPHSVRWLAQYLNAQGYTVYAPLLAGHGTSPQELARVSWRDWAADTLAGNALLRSRCRKVFAMGVSLGGALSLWLGANVRLDGVIALAAPNQMRLGWRLPMLSLMSLFGGMLPDPVIPPDQDAFLHIILAEQKKRGEKPLGRLTYGTKPAHALLQVFALLRDMRAGLPAVSAPTLFIHSLADHVVPFENLQRNFDSVGAADKRMLVLESDRHGIAEHPDLMPEVFGAVGEFIAAHV